jgi:hypothetical protein
MRVTFISSVLTVVCAAPGVNAFAIIVPAGAKTLSAHAEHAEHAEY